MDQIINAGITAAKAMLPEQLTTVISTVGEPQPQPQDKAKEKQKRVKHASDKADGSEEGLLAKVVSKSKRVSVAASAATHKLSAQINEHKLPRVVNVEQSGHGELRFTLENADVSIANAIRRTILSEIPALVFNTDVQEGTTENTVFHVNTTRHHNEILKQRLRCIPICIPEKQKITDFDFKAYRCEVKKKNTTDVAIYVTTGDFKVIDKSTGKEDLHLTKQMFVPDKLSGHYIEFARLLPRVVEYTDGEELYFSAEFQISTAEKDAAYNVCSTCTYACTPDKKKQDEAWEKEVANLKEGEAESQQVQTESEKNWRLSHAQRIVKPNSFDFVIETVSMGVYTNDELVRKACECIKIKCKNFIETVTNDTIVESKMNVTIPLAYTIILKNEGYTLGKALEHIIYSKHYFGDRTLTFCAFKKTHPHDTDSYIQLALQDDTESNIDHVAAIAVSAANDIISIIDHIKKQFHDT
jgi:DNA-directed RNA polymerase subunit L